MQSTTDVAFNDYQMNSYAGLIQLAFIYRAIQLRVRRGGTVKGNQ